MDKRAGTFSSLARRFAIGSRYSPTVRTIKAYGAFPASTHKIRRSTAGTGDAFADWMLGFPFSSARAYPGDWFGGDATYWHFFVQDDFKVNNRLTLNLGSALRVFALDARL